MNAKSPTFQETQPVDRRPRKVSDPAGYAAMIQRRQARQIVTARLQMSISDPQAIQGLSTVAARTGVPEVTLRRWAKLGRFPAPLRCGRRIGWPAAVVTAWLEQLAATGGTDRHG